MAMQSFKGKQKVRSVIYSPWFLLLLLIVAVFLVKGAYAMLSKEWRSGQVLDALEEKNAKLREREAELRGSIEALGTEAGLVQEIRAKFNATREGEYLAVLVEGALAQVEGEEVVNGHWYQKLWSAIMRLIQ